MNSVSVPKSGNPADQTEVFKGIVFGRTEDKYHDDSLRRILLRLNIENPGRRSQDKWSKYKMLVALAEFETDQNEEEQARGEAAETVDRLLGLPKDPKLFSRPSTRYRKHSLRRILDHFWIETNSQTTTFPMVEALVDIEAKQSDEERAEAEKVVSHLLTLPPPKRGKVRIFPGEVFGRTQKEFTVEILKGVSRHLQREFQRDFSIFRWGSSPTKCALMQELSNYELYLPGDAHRRYKKYIDDLVEGRKPDHPEKKAPDCLEKPGPSTLVALQAKVLIGKATETKNETAARKGTSSDTTTQKYLLTNSICKDIPERKFRKSKESCDDSFDSSEEVGTFACATNIKEEPKTEEVIGASLRALELTDSKDGILPISKPAIDTSISGAKAQSNRMTKPLSRKRALDAGDDSETQAHAKKRFLVIEKHGKRIFARTKSSQPSNSNPFSTILNSKKGSDGDKELGKVFEERMRF